MLGQIGQQLLQSKKHGPLQGQNADDLVNMRFERRTQNASQKECDFFWLCTLSQECTNCFCKLNMTNAKLN